jgi:hypothetical protein
MIPGQLVSWREWWNDIESRRTGRIMRVHGQTATVKGQFGKEQEFYRVDLRVENRKAVGV